MKKTKFILIIIFILFLTGCSSNYDLNLDTDSIDEKLTINMTKEEYMENYDTLISNKSVFDDNSVFYDIDIIDNVDNYLVTYSHSYDHEDYFNSLNLNSCFNEIYHDIYGNQETINLVGFNCLQGDSLRVIVDSKYKIYNSNAHIVNGNKNIWDIDSNNKDNINISFVVDYNKTYFNKDLVLSILLIIVLICLVAILFKKKKKVRRKKV